MLLLPGSLGGGGVAGLGSGFGSGLGGGGGTERKTRSNNH